LEVFFENDLETLPTFEAAFEVLHPHMKGDLVVLVQFVGV
jgi:hypothetical protein